MKDFSKKWVDSLNRAVEIPQDELEEAIRAVNNGSKAEKYLATLVEASKRYMKRPPKVNLYNEEHGLFCGRLEALYCPTCHKKIPFGETKMKGFIQRCAHCGQTCVAEEWMLDLRYGENMRSAKQKKA